MAEDVHADNLAALRAERDSLEQRAETPSSAERKAALEQEIARLEAAAPETTVDVSAGDQEADTTEDADASEENGEQAEGAPETTEDATQTETTVPPGPLSKRRGR